MAIALRVQNVYGDALRAFKVFLDRVTRNTLTKIEWNYGAKPLEYHYMQQNESYEYPNAIIEIQDIQPVDGVSPIARNAGMHINQSNHHQTIAENISTNEKVIIDKRWVNLMFSVQINTEDVASLLNYHDLFITTMPLQYYFYDYKYFAYIEVTPFVEHWDFDNQDIMNVSIRPDATYRYTPDKHYLESPEVSDPSLDPEEEKFNSHLRSQPRDRELGDDKFIKREGYRYFSEVNQEPILKLQSIQKQTDKESQKHSLMLNFEMQMEIPNIMVGSIDYFIETIEIVIDTANKNGIAHEYPLLIDMEENFLINKNIQQAIIVLPEDFYIRDPKDPVISPSYLEIKSDINLNTFTPSLWAVEDVTEASSKRFFIPLEHATVERTLNDDQSFKSLRFYFDELKWFEGFNFKNSFNYMKLILFTDDAHKNRCSPTG